jgi:hypothetical protein
MKSRRRATILLLLITGSIFLSSGKNRNFISYHLETGSRLWIEGKATIGSYECTTVAVYGIGDIYADDISPTSAYSSSVNFNDFAKLKVLVKFFDCGNPAMNEDMYTALKANQDSIIQYKLINTFLLYDSIAFNGRFGLRTIGDLSIAGVSKRDTIDVDIRNLRHMKYEIIGRKNLSMTDFNIIPPSVFFGLIKAHENLTVNFDLIAAPGDEHFLENTDQ